MLFAGGGGTRRSKMMWPRQDLGPGTPENMVAVMGRLGSDGEFSIPEGSPFMVTWPVSSCIWAPPPAGSCGCGFGVGIAATVVIWKWVSILMREKKRREDRDGLWWFVGVHIAEESMSLYLDRRRAQVFFNLSVFFSRSNRISWRYLA